MLKTERKAWRGFAHLIAGSALMLAVGSAVSAQAPGPAPAPGPGRGRLPQQGFEATGQNPANYTPEEAAAVAVVKKWIETTVNHDLAGHMALIDDNVLSRPDPEEPLLRGARLYCRDYGFVRSAAFVRLDELYVVGGRSETIVLLKRTDINGPATGNGGGLGGYPVPVAVFARVKNGKITEWYDAPVNKVSVAALPFTGLAGRTRPVPEVCMKYPEGSK